MAQAKLKIYRQAVLQKAFEGEFTREWREKHNNPRIQKWCEVALKEIVMDVTQGWSPKCLNEHSSNHEEWAVIKTSAIQHNAFLEYENKILPTHLEPRIQHELKDGDILITRAGPRNRVGACCLIENIRPRLINCDKAYRLRLNNEKILNKFFILKINSHEYIQKINFIKTGGSDSGLNLTQTRFLSLEFSIPSLEEQNQIVQEIESRLSICDKIEETIKQTLLKSESLRQSILKKAFEGNLLTTQELEAIHSHSDYESAEKLLKRIKQERAK
jgi:type I restriction enzyme S subunit